MTNALRTHRSYVVGAVVAVALLAGLVVLGRWERYHNARVQNARMLAVYRKATVNGLDSPELGRYRLDAGFDCLVYHPVGKPGWISAYELCFDPQGRLVQTIDRTGKTAAFSSLLEQHSLATFRLPVSTLMALFAKRGVLRNPEIRGTSPHASLLPTAPDTGALPLPIPFRGS